MSEAAPWVWPAERVHEAIRELAQRTGLSAGNSIYVAPHPAADPEHAAQQLGVELEPVALTSRQLQTRVRALGAAIVYTRHDHGQGFIAVLSGRGAHMRLLTPEGNETRVSISHACDLVWAEQGDAHELDQQLAAALPDARLRARARARLLADHIDTTRACRALLLGAASEATLGAWIRRYSLGGKALILIGLHFAQYALGLLAFWTVGQAVLSDRIDAGVFSAFALLSISVVPLHILEGAQLSELSLRLSALFKQRAFMHALESDHDVLRRRGVGEHFGHVLDCDAFESLAVTGGLSGALALSELIAAAVLLALAAGAWLLVALGAWLVLLWFLSVRYLKAARTFASARLQLTHALVERMLAHRTRMVQELRAQWHHGEDELLASYLLAGREHDRHTARLIALSGRGFLTLAVVLLAPQWLSTQSPSSALLASGLASVLLAYRALSRLSNSLTALCDAKLAYERLSTIQSPHPPPRAQPVPAVFEPAQAAVPGEIVLRAEDLSYTPPGRPQSVLDRCSLQLQRGERLLLTGSSGSGKSTLASLLAGLREQGSGTLLLRGLDRSTLGLDGWRSCVALAPQFHENHVFAGTFAFNLLLGRHWPPGASELAEAEAMCLELGLSGLLDRMPARLQQQLGETGWQLSHGERSRLFLARALLARRQVVLLDESFAALDPMTLELCLQSALRHSPTLVVVAHP